MTATVDLRNPSSLEAPRGAAAKWMVEADPRTVRSVRRLLVLTAITPLLVLVGSRSHRFAEFWLLASYGALVILGTSALMYLAFVRYRDPVLDAVVEADAEELPLVSVIIPVRDEADNIETCIRSVLDSTYREVELLVVDDASTDGTGAVLDRLRGIDPRLEVISLENNLGKKRACTLAARRASGSIIAFTDSDCTLAPDALERCVDVFRSDPGVGGLSGHARALNASRSVLTRIQDVWYDSQFAVAKAAESSFGAVTCVSGPLAVFRREAIINYLPAWEADRFAGSEFRFATDRQLTAYVLGQEWVGDGLKERFHDDPLVWREDHPLRRWRVVYSQSARVWTDVPHTARRFLRQQIRWKKSFIRNLFFNSPWMWRRGAGPAALYYMHALWVLVAPMMAFWHLVVFPIQGAVLLTVLYMCGVVLKGCVWAVAYRIHNPRCTWWVYRPLMSVVSTIALSWLIVYSAVTLRRAVWARN